MRDEHNPDKPLISFEIHEAAAATKKWTLALFRNFIELESKEGRVFEIDRADVPERVQKVEGGFLRRVLMVTLDKKKVMFQLSPDAYSVVSAWIGPPTDVDLKIALKRRLGYVTPIGILFVLSALPIGDLDWNPVSLALGLGLILTARFARLWPHRNFFLIDSLWFAALAANSVWLLTIEWGWFRCALLLLQLACVRGGWREYCRFAPEKMAGADEQPSKEPY